jgi:hypothetical protein
VGLALLAAGCLKAPTLDVAATVNSAIEATLAVPDIEATVRAAVAATQAAVDIGATVRAAIQSAEELQAPPPTEGVAESPTVAPTGTPPPTPTPSPTSTPEPIADATNCRLGAKFVRDVTIPDNSEIGRGDAFTKTWRLRNSGTCAWTAAYRLTFIDGEQMGGVDAVSVPATDPGGSGDVSVGLVAPSVDGRHRGTWRMCVNEDQCFGDKLIVQVVSIPPSSTSETSPVTPTLSCDSILAANLELTGAQWNDYVRELEGAQVTGWQGRITEAGEESPLTAGYPLYVEIIRNCRIYYLVKDEDEASQFAVGQRVTVSGEIEFVSAFLGRVTLHMADGSVRIE